MKVVTQPAAVMERVRDSHVIETPVCGNFREVVFYQAVLESVIRLLYASGAMQVQSAGRTCSGRHD